jgi:hypothetical protein
MIIPPHVLDWLLAEDNPSVCYRTRRDLLGESPTTPELTTLRARLATSKPVEKIMARMAPEGYWLFHGKGEGIDYAHPNTTHFVLAYLAELGLDRQDERVARAVERYLSLPAPTIPDPAPWQIPPDYRNHQSCLYAYNLRTLILLGYGKDPRIAERVEVLLRDARHDGGYLCDRTQYTPRTKSCIRGSLKALTAFAALPALWDTPRCSALVGYFLRRRLFYRMDAPDQIIRSELTRLAFPFTYNGSLIEPLYALSVMGYGQREELREAWDILATKQDEQGRYILDWAPDAWLNPGPKGQPNKWVTLYAYLARQHAERAGAATKA